MNHPQDAHDRLHERYRWLLRAYPKSYRQRRGEEILGTLMDTATPGQARPSIADALDLISAGARQRLGLDSTPAVYRGLSLAGPIALSLAAAFSLAFSLIAEPNDPYLGSWAPTKPSLLLAPVCYGIWVLGFVVSLVFSRLPRQPVIVVAVLVTAGAHISNAIWPKISTPQWPALLLLLGLGLVALAGCGHHPTPAERAGVAAVFVGAMAVGTLTFLASNGTDDMRMAQAVLVTCAALLVVLAAIGVRRVARERSWLWATAMLFTATSWTAAFAIQFVARPRWAGIWATEILFASLTGLTALMWISRLRAREHHDTANATRDGIKFAAAMALGTGAALSVVAVILDVSKYDHRQFDYEGWAPPLASQLAWRLGSVDVFTAIACAAWLAAAVAWLVSHKVSVRLTPLGVAVVATLASLLMRTSVVSPRLLMVLTVLGVAAVAAMAVSTQTARRAVGAGVGVAGAGIAIVLGAVFAFAWGPHRVPWSLGLYPILMRRTNEHGVITDLGLPPGVAIAGLAPLALMTAIGLYWLALTALPRLRRAPQDTATG